MGTTAATMRPIDRMNAEWAWVGRSPEARAATEALARAEPLVRASGARDLVALVGGLRGARDAAGRDRAAHVVQAMLRSAGTHPLVPRAILQALVPGLVGVARRLSWGAGGEWADGGAFFADAVTTAWEVVTEWSGQDRPYAVLDLLSAVRCRLRRQVARHRALVEQVTPGLGDDETAAPPTAAGTDLEVLARTLEDLTGRGLDPVDAAVVYGRRVLGLTLAELAELSGRSPRQLRQRHRHAAQAICRA